METMEPETAPLGGAFLKDSNGRNAIGRLFLAPAGRHA